MTSKHLRLVTVAAHEKFRRDLHASQCIDLDDCGRDAIDRELDDCILIDPHVTGAPSRRSDKELSRMLELIDNLPISDSGEDGSL
jgi:hypothetical protein